MSTSMLLCCFSACTILLHYLIPFPIFYALALALRFSCLALALGLHALALALALEVEALALALRVWALTTTLIDL